MNSSCSLWSKSSSCSKPYLSTLLKEKTKQTELIIIEKVSKHLLNSQHNSNKKTRNQQTNSEPTTTKQMGSRQQPPNKKNKNKQSRQQKKNTIVKKTEKAEPK